MVAIFAFGTSTDLNQMNQLALGFVLNPTVSTFYPALSGAGVAYFTPGDTGIELQYQTSNVTYAVGLVGQLTYQGNILSGNIDTISFSENFATGQSEQILTIWDTSVSAKDFFNLINSGGTQALFKTILTGPTVIDGSNYADTLIGPNGGDTISSLGGGDSVAGGDGNDLIYTSSTSPNTADAATVLGMAGNDTINGSAGANSINGNQGNDSIVGGNGGNSLFGGQGDNSIVSHSVASGGDSINGNLGNDVIHGSAGSDTIYGGQGNDTIYAGSGNQTISGDLGNDILFAGTGKDNFLFAPGAGADWIAGWNAAQDHIVLPTGTAYTVGSYQGQVLIAYGNGDTIGLAGVAPSAFSSSWIIFS